MFSKDLVANRFTYSRWTVPGQRSVAIAGLAVALFAFAPLVLPAIAVDRLTILWIYVILAVMWNLLAGFGGMVSVGQQAFFGLGGYFTLRLVDYGLSPWPALLIGAGLVALVALPLSFLFLKLKDGEFAIGTWVLAEVILILVMFDPLIQGDTGNSLIALNAYEPELRRNVIYWLGLAGMAGFVTATFFVLRSRTGAAVQAIRDDEDAAKSIGISTLRVKQLIFVLAAFGAALAGVIWLASAITFLPRTNFGIQWTVYMLFMVLVGGLRSFEGPIIGAIVFFVFQTLFDHLGVWYMAGLGAIAVFFALAVPEGLWGLIRKSLGYDMVPMGTMIEPVSSSMSGGEGRTSV